MHSIRTSIPLGLALVLVAGTASASRERFGTPIAFGNSSSRAILFPEDFRFPLGGVNYKSCFITSNGLICFQVSTTGVPTSTSAPSLLISTNPRIAPLWVDLDPALGGTVTAGRRSATEFQFKWNNVPAAGNTANVSTVSCILRTDGTFDFVYGNLNPVPISATAACFVGFSTGNANTAGVGTVMDFTTVAQCPSTIGTGGESAMYQFFNPAAGAAALANRCLRFAPTLPASGKLTLSDDSSVEIGLDGWTFPFHGNRFTSVHVVSNGHLDFLFPDIDFSPTTSELLMRGAKIAPLWGDMNPGTPSIGLGGSITVSQAPGTATFSWSNVPNFGTTATNTFNVTINADGSFSFTYVTVSTTPPSTTPNAIVGQTGGYPMTMGTEVPAVLPTSPIGTAPGAVFDFPVIATFPYSGLINWDNAHTGNSSSLAIGDDDVYEHKLNGVTIQFAGAKYSSVFVSSNGNVMLGGAESDLSETAAELLSLWPRISPAWDDLQCNPTTTIAQEGTLTATSNAGGATISWTAVREFGAMTTNTFSVSITPTGSFAVTYGAMALLDALVGYAAGGDKTAGTETGVDLSTAANWGTGNQSAIFQLFTAAIPFDLANSSVTFGGAAPIVFQTAAISSPGVVPVCLGAGATDANLGFAVAMAMSSVPGIPVPGCAMNIPLNLDPLLVLILTLNGAGIITPGIQGVMDAWGQHGGWPDAPTVSPLAVNVPGGLGSLGVVLYMAFVTYPGGGGCPFATISPAATFAIP